MLHPRSVGGDPSPCVGPAARDAMLLTAETGKQVMACREDRRKGKEGERREGLGEKERFQRGREEKKKKAGRRRGAFAATQKKLSGFIGMIYFLLIGLGTKNY